MPSQLERRFDGIGEDSVVRSAIINLGDVWTLSQQSGLMGQRVTSRISTGRQAAARTKAFDLLDALTKAGAISIECASVHVVITAACCYDKSLMNCLVEGNVNPINAAESALLALVEVICGASICNPAISDCTSVDKKL
jgi:hypothetical protein